MGKRRLAYEIEKKREGVYFLVYFSVGASHIKELWNEYHLHEDLIRFSTQLTEDVLESLEFKPLVVS